MGSFCEKLPEDSPISDRTKPGSSKVESPLAKAKPTSISSSTSGITDFRAGEGEIAIAARPCGIPTLEQVPGRTDGRGAHAKSGLLKELVTP